MNKFKKGDVVEIKAGGYWHSDNDRPLSGYGPSFGTHKHYSKKGEISKKEYSETNQSWWYQIETYSNWISENGLRLVSESKTKTNIMSKFKVGDEIRVTGTRRNNHTSEKAMIDRFKPDGDIWFRREDNGSIENYCHPDDCELISKKTTMSKLNSMMKKILDKGIRTLVRADFINGDLQLTAEGLEALNTILFSERKDELVKLAQERIDELEAEK